MFVCVMSLPTLPWYIHTQLGMKGICVIKNKKRGGGSLNEFRDLLLRQPVCCDISFHSILHTFVRLGICWADSMQEGRLTAFPSMTYSALVNLAQLHRNETNFRHSLRDSLQYQQLPTYIIECTGISFIQIIIFF